jgi:hypothetical protein
MIRDAKMLRPTKRILIDLVCVLGMWVTFLVAGPPWIGDRSAPSGKPHTALSIILFYGIGTAVTAAAVIDLVRAVRSGGASIRGRRRSTRLDLPTDTWSWLEPIKIERNEGVWFSGKFLDSTSDLIKMTFGLARAGVADGPPELVGDTHSREVAWEAEDFPEETLVPPQPGEYMLGIRATSSTPGKVRVKLVWGCSPTRK